MEACDRPQEKMLFTGPSVLSNSELVALIIRNGTKDRSAIQLAEDVISYASVHTGGLGAADARELTKIDGIGLSKACAIVAAAELGRRLISDWTYDNASNGPRLHNSDEVAELLLREMMYEKRELLMSIHLNTRCQVESKMIISIGSLDSTLVAPREVYAPAIRKGAAAIIIAHNHPSGDPSPSAADFDITKRIYDSSVIIGIPLLDHVIIGSGTYYSMKANGYLTGSKADAN